MLGRKTWPTAKGIVMRWFLCGYFSLKLAGTVKQMVCTPTVQSAVTVFSSITVGLGSGTLIVGLSGTLGLSFRFIIVCIMLSANC